MNLSQTEIRCFYRFYFEPDCLYYPITGPVELLISDFDSAGTVRDSHGR